ncbi:hypothetical protein HUN01_33890 [Nostoc edaphicum CCNP1411]|uniref:Uncharacterized protein n=1 Tax=Nostoc edaphicum CCNP1411 TaxID=1472755 RepID=A0A7D7QS81_9NOSO|nr:hypothetical protein [Nostoc edaphicum]QMS92340.1 hypothetical protein HUN01_33890 [Nostoc edaphicum CCNP1411]
MFTEDELKQWFISLKLEESTKTVIEQIRTSEPLRRVGGGGRNVSGNYSSIKMGIGLVFDL